MAHINSLPDEVLVKIFHFYLLTETQSNFVKHVSNVCKNWKRVSKDSSLFDTVDGSLSSQTIVNLATAGSLETTKILKFGPINKEKNGQYRTIYANMPRLKRLDISGLYPELNKKKNHPVLTELEGLCPDLCELVLSLADAHCKLSISHAIFDHILIIRGHNFVKLDFSGVIMVQLTKLFLHIANNCPNLEELCAENLKQYPLLQQFPIENMQKGLPNLKTLRLGPPIIFTNASGNSTLGFPNLEIFTYPNEHTTQVESSTLEALLHNSPKLKILDFRGCIYVLYETVSSLPAVNLEQIYLSRTRMLEARVSLKLFQKWSHSLKVIHMADTGAEHINERFLPEHLPNGLPKLQELNISFTGISDHALKIVIQQCPELRYLNVQSHGRLRSVYHSRSEIEDLLLKLDRIEIDCN